MEYFLIFVFEFFLLFFLSRKLTQSVSSLLFRLTKNPNHTIRIFHTLFLPGVIVHELSHLITSEVMFVKTHGLSLSLERHGDELTMGSVQIEQTDPVRRAIIGFAPMLVGFLLISVVTFFLLSDRSPFGHLVNYLIVLFVVFEIGNTMFSSKKDLEGAVELIIFLILVIIVAYFFGFNFSGVTEFLNSDQAQEVLLKGIKVLLIPITINLVIIFVSRFLTQRN